MPATQDDVIELVAVQLGANNIELGHQIVEDLGAESADIINIISALESRFNIQIDDAAIPDIHTVGDLAELVRSETGPK